MRYLTPALCLTLATAAGAEVPRVATDIAPVHSLVSIVMQGVGAPDLTIPPGASPHSYAMRPSEARALAGADLVVWVGPALTPWLAEPMATLATGATHVALQDVDGISLLENRSGVAFKENDHADEHGTDQHGHDGSGVDPHLWLDPQNAALWLSTIADTLAEMDPDNAATYRSNATQGQADLAELTASLQARLAPVQGRPFVVFHDAYHYFEARFDTEARAALSLSDGAAPSAARLAEVRQVIADTNAVCVFTEPQFNPGLVGALQDEGTLKSAALDPLGGALTLGPALYPDILTGLAEAFLGCLSD